MGHGSEWEAAQLKAFRQTASSYVLSWNPL